MKIIMMGALAKRRNFPTDLRDTHVWGLNAIYPSWVPRWDARFNLHTHTNLMRYKWKEEFFRREVEFSSQNPDVPFYTLDRWPIEHGLEGWQQFPAAFMMEHMHRGQYHCGSMDWMVAFAIWRNRRFSDGIREIELHGVQLTSAAGEPISARACLEYWCGGAEGSGIKVELADDAHLFDNYHLVRSDIIYGVDDAPVIEQQSRREITERLARAPVPYDYED
jgi:hypothetical protein